MQRALRLAVFVGVAATSAVASGTPDPSDPIFQQPGPAKYVVDFDTTAGAFSVEVDRESAPHGADRFYGLVKEGFYNGNSFFRVAPGFVVQWGINGNPDVQSHWRDAHIPDDPNKRANAAGTLTFATSGPNSRTTQLFLNLKGNSFLDGQGFAPFGKVLGDGMSVVQAINSEAGQTPDQGRIQHEGDAYLKSTFPRLTVINSATIHSDAPATPVAAAAATPPQQAAALHTPVSPGGGGGPSARNAMTDILSGKPSTAHHSAAHGLRK